MLVIAGVISGHNMAGYPQRFEDEGTYVSQAYAVEVKHQLTHYTYWYDHPPAGWIQIAGYTTITHAFERYSSAISAGREFMLVIHLICVLLLYAIARRLGIGTLASSLGVGLYALSPLTIEFSRYVLLDNVALPWLLAAFLLALSPRQKLGYAIASAVCMAIAILSKETFIVLLPVLIYTLWANGDRRNRRYALVSFAVVLTMVSSSYILYAALKNELLPGPGHVSLIGTFVWQLFGRAGSGSVFDPSSGTRGLIQFWLNIDPWLMIAGIASLPIALVNRRVRPLALGLLVGLLLLLRTGYLPYPYIIALLPFAAICLAQAFQTLIITPLRTLDAGWRNYTSTIVAAVTAITILLMASISVIPQWQTSIAAMTTQDYDLSSRQAVNWINHNVGRENRLVVESALWTDLQSKGFNKPQPVWLYKTETDPAVTKMIGGWKGIDYVVLDGPTISQNSARDFPTVYTAIAHSKLVATFGTDNQKILVYQVNHGDK